MLFLVANRGEGRWREAPEGIRTLQISGHAKSWALSPPSFAAQMPPPLTARGAARGGFGNPANSHCSANFERRAFIPLGARRDEPPLPAEETGLHFLFISGMLLYIALCTRYFLREGMDALWAEIRWI